MAELEGLDDDGVLAGLISASGQLESLESLDAAFTANTGSFTARQTSTSDPVDIDLNYLPEVNMPSLESILNEKEEETIPLVDDLDLAAILQSDVPSLSDLDLNTGGKKKKHNKHGSVLRHVVLKNVSGQIMSASVKVDAGLPTTMAVSSLIAVGTSHGIILVFDPKQALKLVLGTTAIGAEYGAVTALGINMDCTRLLCGHARGQITMWDLQSGKLLRTISDAHPIGSAVLHILFTDDPTVAICSDSGGSVFVLSFKRVIGVRTYESTCLFSGSRGEVCCMAPLHMHSGMKEHPLYEYSMLALATLTKVLVLSLKPTLEVLFTHTLRAASDSLPLLSWQFAIIQVSSKKIIDPVLAFGRGNEIHFYQAHSLEEKKVEFIFLQRIETTHKIIAMQWMNSQILATVDTLERLHVIDVRSTEELEVLDLSAVRLVYSSSYFKSLSTGGNVSKALAMASEHSCYQSIVVFNGQILLLGRETVHVMTIRPWRDRIATFVKMNKFLEALELAVSFYEGSAKAVVGLFGNQEKRREQVAAEIEEILLAFVDITVFVNCPKTKDVDELSTYFKGVIPVFIENCLVTNNLNLLFREIYDKLSEEPVGKLSFLECVEPYILADKLRALSPIAMRDFIEYYQSNGKLKEVEACLMHLDVTNLDIHQMVKLCWAHGLYDAIFYVYNRGMRDYSTPLEELVSVLKSSLHSREPMSKLDQGLGYKLLVYISCSLAGRAYPVGDIPGDIVSAVKSEVFKCIMAEHTKDGFENESSFPRLRVLLEFDTQEFLNVLSMAFEEKDFDEDFHGPNGTSGRQFVVNVLLEIMVQDTVFTPSQVGSLFTFLARQMAKHESRIHVSKVLFEQILEYLANPDDDARHEERQQALMELLLAGGLKEFDDERVLVLAENAKFYRVCEMLYEKQRQFAKVLSCYFRDSSRKERAFTYIHNVMTDDLYTDLERDEVKEAALNSLQELVSINCGQTAHLVLTDIPDMLGTVVSRLEGQTEIQFMFLKGVFDSRSVKERQEKVPDVEIQEKYIELMCKFEAGHVHTYLRGIDNYRLEQTLAIVRQYNNTYATAYLLEKAGDVEGAFQLLLQTLKEKVNLLCDAFQNEEELLTRETKTLSSGVEAVLLGVIIPLCQRNSSKLEEADREALWFPLLETVMAPQRKCKTTTSAYFQAFKDFTRHVLNSMMGHISLPAILRKIMQDPTYNTGKFGEIKELLLGMLDTYTYESTLLRTTNHLLASDLHSSLSRLKLELGSGLSPNASRCGICARLCTESSVGHQKSMTLFRCGHIYHLDCIQGVCGVDDLWICMICNKTKITRTSSSRSRSSKASTSKGGGASTRVSRGEAPGTSKGEHEFDRPQETLTDRQFEAVARIRRQTRGPSRYAILSELSKGKDTELFGLSYGSTPAISHSIFQDEVFRLCLLPPPH